MGDGAKPSDKIPRMGEHLHSVEDLAPVWDDFRAGRAVHCPRDASPMALAVDAGAASYRFVCTACGNSSPWFESGPAGMRVRGGVTALGATSTLVDE